MVFGLQWGAWEGSSRKLARPTAWTAPAAHTASLPLSKGDGRFLARVPTTRWIRTRYSSLRCCSQKASVSAVMAINEFGRLVRVEFPKIEEDILFHVLDQPFVVPNFREPLLQLLAVAVTVYYEV